LPGEILRTRIDLTAGCNRLGLQLSGQTGKVPTDNFTCGVFVAGILPDGAAAKNEVIRVGDQILQVRAIGMKTWLSCTLKTSAFARLPLEHTVIIGVLPVGKLTCRPI
jgi:C-terminal processing protease CtpA/Prc